MTRQEFEEGFESLIDEHLLENDNYEDVHICHTTSWKGMEERWMIDVDIVRERK